MLAYNKEMKASQWQAQAKTAALQQITKKYVCYLCRVQVDTPQGVYELLVQVKTTDDPVTPEISVLPEFVLHNQGSVVRGNLNDEPRHLVYLKSLPDFATRLREAVVKKTEPMWALWARSVH